ncbi:hypothetical protein [Rhizobium sp. P44RR-XXIV]|uniref:hypothetical protein n=1 Tax=Rhizobium sp. P44RR-XXIV TaxID=1921145 RepID=UPI0009852C61|nr:hypothetical protein [Rhizobium sp. P44RR-XXIV]TIX88632.1 hypothetical protein BSK43_018335 [Rhizobium sp. P44RR-XXIV]
MVDDKPSDRGQIVKFITVRTDGQIRQSGAIQRQHLETFAAVYPGCRTMEVPAEQYRLDIDAHCYVLDGIITAKGVALDVTEYTIRADGADKASFAVPAGTSVNHDGDIVVIEDHLFEFATDVFGDHQFRFLAPAAFYDFEVTIHAV